MKIAVVSVNSCTDCPHCEVRSSGQFSYREDYTCTKAYRLIAGDVEYPSEQPQFNKFPDWCPLEDVK